MKSTVYSQLTPEQQALVAIGVLLDGREAERVFSFDPQHGALLQETAAKLAEFSPELRMPFIGTLLREALEEI
jgi:hypothetical protein